MRLTCAAGPGGPAPVSRDGSAAWGSEHGLGRSGEPGESSLGKAQVEERLIPRAVCVPVVASQDPLGSASRGQCPAHGAVWRPPSSLQLHAGVNTDVAVVSRQRDREFMEADTMPASLEMEVLICIRLVLQVFVAETVSRTVSAVSICEFLGQPRKVGQLRGVRILRPQAIRGLDKG